MSRLERKYVARKKKKGKEKIEKKIEIKSIRRRENEAQNAISRATG